MQGVPASLAERLQELTYDERAVAYLQVDTALTLIDAGGQGTRLPAPGPRARG